MEAILEELNDRLDPAKLLKSKKYVERFLGVFGEIPEDVLQALRSPSVEEQRLAIKKLVAKIGDRPQGWFINQIHQLLECKETLVRDNFRHVLKEFVFLLSQTPNSENRETARRLTDTLIDHSVDVEE